MPETNLLSSNEEELRQLASSLAGQYKQEAPVQEQVSPQLDTQLRERARALAQQYHSARTDVRPLGGDLYAEIPPPEVTERMEKVEEEAYVPKEFRPVTIGAMTPKEEEFAERRGVSYEMETAPPVSKEIAGWSKDPKYNYISQKIAERAPLWLTAFAGAPAIIGIFEGLQQLKNVTLSLKEKSKYDPIAHRQLTELIPEDAPSWLKTASSTGEVAADMIIAAITARKLSPKVFKDTIKHRIKQAEKAGYPKETLNKVEAMAKQELRPATLDEELARAIKARKAPMPKPRGRRLEEPATIPEEPIAPEMEIRISKDPTTGEAVIKIPKGKEFPKKVEVFGAKPWDSTKKELQKRLDEKESIADVYEEIPKEMPIGKFPKALRIYHEKLFREEAIPKEAPSAAEEARKVRLEEVKRVEEKPLVEPEWFADVKDKLPAWFKEWKLDPEKHGEMYERVVENFKPRGGDIKEELKAYVMGTREYISRETGLAKKIPKEEQLREEIVTEEGRIFREPAEEEAVLKPRERRPTPEEIYERKVIKPSPTKEEAIIKYVDKIRANLSDSEKVTLDSIIVGRSLREGAKKAGISHEQHRKDIIKLKERMRIDPEFRRIAGEREIEIDEELADRYEKAIEKAVKEAPEKIEDLPIDGVANKKTIEFFEEPTKEQNRQARKASAMLRVILDKQKFHKPNTLRNEFEKAKLDLPDELSYQVEQIYADKIVSKARGYVDKYVERMREDGVREEIIESIKVASRYPITKLIKIKREPKTGEISAVISKSLIDYVKSNYKGEGSEQFVKRFSGKHLKKQIEKGLSVFKVPQYFFDGLGLKEIIYDPIRVGERNAEVLRRSLRQEVKSIFKALSKKERQQVFHFMAAKQGKARDMKEAGIEPPKLSALSKEQKKAIVRWRELSKRYRNRVLELSRNHGVELRLVDNYFPLYTKDDLVLIGGEGTYIEAIRKDPFFKSIIPRKEKVPYNIYEYDAYKNALAFSHGLANFLEIGRKTLPVKYLIDSREFKEIVSPDVHRGIVDWYKSIVNPQRGSEFWRFFRRAGYRTFLGLNPVVTAKQGISYLDVAIIEKMPMVIPPRIKQIISRLEKPSVTERLPEIAIVDLTSKADRALLAGIIHADRLFARMGLSRALAGELMAMEKEGIKLDSNSLRKALNRVSDRIDLAMAGVTRAQRPPAFRTELGKMVLMFNSTINSRLQYYIKNMRGVKGANPKDLFRIAKILTAFLLGGYIEASLSNLALNWADRKEMLEDILKATASNVPVVGGLLFALDTGNWSPSAVFSNIENGLKMISQWSKERVTPERMLLSVAEVIGLPKQVRKTYEGIVVIEEGKRVAGKKVIEISEPVEQFRAIVRGQYGPQKVKEFYRLRELKTDYHKSIAKKLAGIKDERLRSWLKGTKLSYFKRNFAAVVKRRLPESERDEIKKIIKEAKEKGIKISYQSIFYHLKEYLD